jgi:AraC-like DNA-binding protein
MDPISDICSSLEIKDLLSGQLHKDGRWAIRLPSYRDVTVCASLQGSFWLSVNGVDFPARIEEGDCYLIANRHAYRMGSDLETEAVEYDIATRQGDQPPSGSIDVATRRPSGEHIAVVGARFAFDDASANLLRDLLPPLIHVRAASECALVLRSMLQVLSAETAAPKIGATVMTSHLAHILLVQALRAYLGTEERPHGWLGALADSKIGSALALMHRDVAREWTVDDLAATAGMSRSSFALKFKTLVGKAPLDYWLQVRMRRAGQLLRNSSKTVASVAYAWGYESEKSFGKAFKRVMGCPPSSYRKAGNDHRINADWHLLA